MLLRMSERSRDTLAWVLLIGVILFSVLRTQSTNDQVAHQNDALAESQTQVRNLVIQMAKQQQCTEDFLSSTVEAANERTSLSPQLNEADKKRIQAQGRLIGFLVQANQNPTLADQKQYTKVLNEYFDQLQRYLDVLGRTDTNQRLNPYPTKDDYRLCLSSGIEEEKP